MSLHPQHLLPISDEIAVDLFAGGGGASVGYEMATGRSPDVAINHDAAAIEMHKANHPTTLHLRCDVYDEHETDPRRIMRELFPGRKVGFLWMSPDCTGFSKAKGGRPERDATKRRRALAWVGIRWAGTVRPRVIALENVEEFQYWTRLVGTPDNRRECKKTRGRRFRKFVRELKSMGYAVEWRELRACDFGAPTIRKRLILIARCDGQPIVWPAPTHGDPNSADVKSGKLKPWRTAAECIDWSIPMLSIFATREEAKAFAIEHSCGTPQRPLKPNTLRRVARGVTKFVVDNPKPFTRRVDARILSPMVCPITHGGEHRMAKPATAPLNTVTCAERGEIAVVAPCFVARYGEREGQAPRARSVESPMPTVVNDGNGATLVAASISTFYGGPGGDDRGAPLGEPLRTQGTENRHALVASLLSQQNGGFYEGGGRPIDAPMATILGNGKGHQPLVAASLQRDFGTSTGQRLSEPARTVTADGGGHVALVASFLEQYNGTAEGQPVTAPIPTISTRDRFGLVTVKVNGKPHVITDIYMRMLAPRELYNAQGFPPKYVIDRGADGRPLTKAEQVRMCGNSVSPPMARAIITANAPFMVARPEKVIREACHV